MRRSWLAFPLCALIQPAFAAPPEAYGGKIVAGIRECRSIGAPDRRLACFDAAAAALDDALSRRDITVLDKQEVVRTRRSLFGFQLPNLRLFGAGERDVAGEDQKELDTSIRSVRAVSYGKYAITVAEGAVWQNTDLMDYAPQAGEKVHLKEGLIGSYFMRVGSNRPVRAMRIR